MIDINAVQIAAFLILIAGVVGAALPLFTNLTERMLHRILALGTGMLLGTIFYHMLPEALDTPGAASFLLVGLLGVFVVERLIFSADAHSHEVHKKGQGEHAVLGATAFLGLSVHALTASFGLAVQLNDPVVYKPLLISMLIHKLSEAFALAAILLLAEVPRKRAIRLMLLFVLITPVGIISGDYLVHLVPQRWAGGLSGLASGTFLYVALCDLLPEVFHDRQKRWLNLALLIIGIVFIGIFLNWGGTPHIH